MYRAKVQFLIEGKWYSGRTSGFHCERNWPVSMGDSSLLEDFKKGTINVNSHNYFK